MEPTPTPTPTPVPSTTPPPTEPTPPPPPPPPPSPPQTQQPPPSSTPDIPTPSPQNPNPNPTPPQQNPQISTPSLPQQTLVQQSQPRPQQQQQQQQPQQLSRARPQYPQHIPSLPSPSPSQSTTFSPSLTSTATATSTSIQRGGLAIGVPAHQQRPPTQPAPFSTYGQSSYATQYGGVSRSHPINVSDTNTTQVKQPIQGIQTTIGNFGSLSGSQLRPGGVPTTTHNQPRALQSSMRSQATPTNQSLANQRFPSPSLLRAPSMISPSSPSPNTPAALQTHTQPWMTAANQGKQMHPSYRQQVKPQTLQQRSHYPQQHHHPMPTVSHQQMPSSQQQQQQQPMSQLHQSQEHYGQQYPVTRVQHPMPIQQQAQRGLIPTNQKIAPTIAQAGAVQSAPPNTVGSVDAGETSSHILSKRTIHELVSQIDPSEKLDPEVEDILMEIAEDFVDSITTVGCSLAKHRKSTTLEAKDILLHLERNWHMTLPGFGGDEIKGYKKQIANDIHKERLAAVKKSMVVPDTVNVKSSGGQAVGNVKGHAAKAPAIGSPKAR